jgi:hypothetical protein
MAFNVSTVKDYVDQNQGELIGKAVLGAKSASLFGVQTGVKGSSTLNLLNATPVLQAGGCGWSASGSTALTQRTIVTGLIKINEALCEKDLIGTFKESELRIAAGTQVIPAEQDFIGQILKGVAKSNEMTIWQGDTTGSTYTMFDGLIKILGAEATVIDATVSGKTLTGNTLDAVNAIVASIPNEIIDREDLGIFVGYEVFRKYVAALQAANLYHYTVEQNGMMELIIPGQNVKLYGVAGLNGTNKAYASYLANFRLGVDMEGDAEKFEFWYSLDNREYRLAIDYNMGVQVAFPDFVVKYIG